MKKYLLSLIFMFGYWQSVYGLALIDVNNQTKVSVQTLNLKFDQAISNNNKVFAVAGDLIIDLYNVNNATNKKRYVFNSGYVREVDLVVVGKRMRVVVIGGAKYKYQINTVASSLSLDFTEQYATPTLSKQKVGLINLPQTKSINSYVAQVNDIKFSRDDNGGGVVEVPYSGDGQISVKDERFGEKLNLTLGAVGFNSSLIKRIDATDFATPIKYIDSSGANNQLVISIINRGLWDYALYQLQGKLIINIRNLEQVNNSSALPNLNNANKTNKVSFNFQNIDVRSLLQLLADFSGYNILVSDSVTGTISIKLNNVPWDQALKIILDSKGLSMSHDGNVIRIAPINEIAQINKLQHDNSMVQEAIEPIDSVMIRLKYAQADKVKDMLMQKGGAALASSSTSPNPSALASGAAPSANKPGLTPAAAEGSLLSLRGSVLVDSRTNTLIINETPSRLKDIRNLIEKIDIPVKQVLIEARIVEASSDFERDLGTRLLLAGIGGSITYSNSLENAAIIKQTGINSVSGNPSSFINQNLSNTGNSAMSAIFSPNSNTLIGLEIDALELQSQGRTISSPKVMTANYQPANIQQGVQIPYQQQSSAGNTNIAFINATLSLQVTPQITEDGYILLNVNIQKNSPSSKLQVQGTPAIDTNSVTTQIRVKDGSTILVGGIYVDDQQEIQAQVPGLGDIPYLGWLFKSRTTKNNKKELLIFITPRIIANSLDNDN